MNSHKYLTPFSSTFIKQAPAVITKYTVCFITSQGEHLLQMDYLSLNPVYD